MRHRLAGVLIGLVSIALVVVTYRKERRRWVRAGSVAILLAVIAQGLLGGMRVRMNEQVLAMTHSITGGLFFTLCFVFAVLLRRGSAEQSAESDHRTSAAGFAIGVILPAVVLGQYVLGGMFRHLGRMLHEHVAGAVIVTLLTVTLLSVLLRSELPSLRQRARWLAAALGLQIALGLGSWATKLGVPTLGWVATVNSPAQNITCSLHTVGGMLLLATSAAVAVELLMLFKAGRLASLADVFGPADVRSPGTGGVV